MTSTRLGRVMTTPLSIQDRLTQVAAEGPAGIDARLAELCREWSAGRMVKASLGVLIFVGFLLTALHDPLWMILPAIAGGLLLQYVFWRGGLLAELFRRFGYRSSTQIDEERFALRALRGDFRNLPTVHEIEDKDSVCRFEDEGGPAVQDEEQRYGHREAAVIIANATK